MADVAIRAAAVQNAPAGYTVPEAQEILVKSVRALVNFGAAASSGRAVLQLAAPDGTIIWESPTSSDIAAGASANVTWFPGLGVGGSGGGGGTAGELSYKELATSIVITGTSVAQQTLITSDPVSLDGSTKIRVESYTPTFDIDGPGNFVAELWMDSTDLGRIGQANLSPSGDTGWPINLIRYLTPAAGTHTFYLKGWHTGGTPTLTADTGGPLLYVPAFLRVSLAVPV